MNPVIIVIPAEGDSPETEIWYIKALKSYYRTRCKKEKLQVLVFEHDGSAEAMKLGVSLSTQLQVRKFIQEHEMGTVEIHAQGGLGAYVAYEFLRYVEKQEDVGFYGKKINLVNVFLIGGAPSNAMTWAAKIFHRYFAPLWYHIRWLVPFFADDPPNPRYNQEIDKIRESSTQTMRNNPRLYRDQLQFIGWWQAPDDWRVASRCNVWYVPNGETLRSKLRDNTYDDVKARACWRNHGVVATHRPEENFSFYSMMPAIALFAVMDEVR